MWAQRAAICCLSTLLASPQPAHSAVGVFAPTEPEPEIDGIVPDVQMYSSFHRCADPDDTDTAIIDQLPRYALDAQKISADMADYRWYRWDETCERAPMVCIDGGRYRPQTSEWGSSCGFDGGVGGQNKGCYQLNVNINSLEVDNAGRYIAGAVMFSVVWFVLAIMVLTFGCSCSTYMACVCLCCRRRPLPQKTDDEDEYGRPMKAQKQMASCFYNRGCRLAMQAVVVLPMVCCCVFLWLGEKNGNSEFVPAMQRLIGAPRQFADMSEDAFSLAEKVVYIGEALANEIIATNATVAAVVDFSTVAEQMLCVEGMIEGLPDTTIVQTELERVQYGLGLVPTSAEMGVILGGLKTSVNALTELLTRSETELSATTASLTELTGGPPDINGRSTGLLLHLNNNLTAAVARLNSATIASSTLKTTIDTFLLTRPMTEIDNTLAQVAAFQTDPAAYAPGTTNRDTMRTNLGAIITAVTTMKTDSAKLTTGTGSIPDVQTKAAAIDFDSVLAAESRVSATLAAVNASLLALKGTVAEVQVALNNFSVASLTSTLGSVDNVTTQYVPNTVLINAELSKIDTITTTMECVTPLVASVQMVNATLLRIPPESDAIVEMLNSATGLAGSMGNASSDITAQLGLFTSSTAAFSSLDMSAQTTEITRVETELKTQSAAPLADMTTQLASVDVLLASASGTDIRGPLLTANSVLGAASLDVPAEICCAAESSIGMFPDSATAATAVLQTFKDGADTSTAAQDPGLQAGAKAAGDVLASLKISLTALAAQLAPIAVIADEFSKISFPSNTVTTATTSLTAAHNSIATALPALVTAGNALAAAKTPFTDANTAFDNLGTQWDGVSSSFDTMKPMLDDAIKMVVGMAGAGSASALPPDVVEQVAALRGMIDNLVVMQQSFNANMTSGLAFLTTTRTLLADTAHSNIMHRTFYGPNTTFKMPKLTPEMDLEYVMNMSKACDSLQCFQDVIAYFDDNFFDVCAQIVAAQLQQDPVKMGFGRRQLFTWLYIWIGVAAGLLIFGTIFLYLPMRCAGACMLWPVSFCFLILATLLYPMTVLMSDTCGGIEHLAYTIVSTDTHLGLNTRELLMRNVSDIEDYTSLIPFANFSIRYNATDVVIPGLPVLFETYFGSCHSEGEGGIRVEDTVKEAGKMIENVSLEIMDFGVGAINAVGGDLKSGMQQHVWNMRNLTSSGVYSVFDDTSQLVGCERFNKAYFEMKSAFCCDFVLMVYWMAISSALIGCCGCWGSCSAGLTARSLRPKQLADDSSDVEDDSDEDSKKSGGKAEKPKSGGRQYI